MADGGITRNSSEKATKTNETKNITNGNSSKSQQEEYDALLETMLVSKGDSYKTNTQDNVEHVDILTNEDDFLLYFLQNTLHNEDVDKSSENNSFKNTNVEAPLQTLSSNSSTTENNLKSISKNDENDMDILKLLEEIKNCSGSEYKNNSRPEPINERSPGIGINSNSDVRKETDESDDEFLKLLLELQDTSSKLTTDENLGQKCNSLPVEIKNSKNSKFIRNSTDEFLELLKSLPKTGNNLKPMTNTLIGSEVNIKSKHVQNDTNVNLEDLSDKDQSKDGRTLNLHASKNFPRNNCNRRDEFLMFFLENNFPETNILNNSGQQQNTSEKLSVHSDHRYKTNYHNEDTIENIPIMSQNSAQTSDKQNSPGSFDNLVTLLTRTSENNIRGNNSEEEDVTQLCSQRSVRPLGTQRSTKVLPNVPLALVNDNSGSMISTRDYRSKTAAKKERIAQVSLKKSHKFLNQQSIINEGDDGFLTLLSQHSGNSILMNNREGSTVTEEENISSLSLQQYDISVDKQNGTIWKGLLEDTVIRNDNKNKLLTERENLSQLFSQKTVKTSKQHVTRSQNSEKENFSPLLSLERAQCLDEFVEVFNENSKNTASRNVDKSKITIGRNNLIKQYFFQQKSFVKNTNTNDFSDELLALLTQNFGDINDMNGSKNKTLTTNENFLGLVVSSQREKSFVKQKSRNNSEEELLALLSQGSENRNPMNNYTNQILSGIEHFSPQSVEALNNSENIPRTSYSDKQDIDPSNGHFTANADASSKVFSLLTNKIFEDDVGDRDCNLDAEECASHNSSLLVNSRKSSINSLSSILLVDVQDVSETFCTFKQLDNNIARTEIRNSSLKSSQQTIQFLDTHKIRIDSEEDNKNSEDIISVSDHENQIISHSQIERNFFSSPCVKSLDKTESKTHFNDEFDVPLSQDLDNVILLNYYKNKLRNEYSDNENIDAPERISVESRNIENQSPNKICENNGAERDSNLQEEDECASQNSSLLVNSKRSSVKSLSDILVEDTQNSLEFHTAFQEYEGVQIGTISTDKSHCPPKSKTKISKYRVKNLSNVNELMDKSAVRLDTSSFNLNSQDANVSIHSEGLDFSISTKDTTKKARKRVKSPFANVGYPTAKRIRRQEKFDTESPFYEPLKKLTKFISEKMRRIRTYQLRSSSMLLYGTEANIADKFLENIQSTDSDFENFLKSQELLSQQSINFTTDVVKQSDMKDKSYRKTSVDKTNTRLGKAFDEIFNDTNLICQEDMCELRVPREVIQRAVIRKISNIFIKITKDIENGTLPFFKFRNQNDWDNVLFHNQRYCFQILKDQKFETKEKFSWFCRMSPNLKVFDVLIAVLRPSSETPRNCRLGDTWKTRNPFFCFRITLKSESAAKYSIISYGNNASKKKFELIVKLLGKIVDLIVNNSTCTKRELYYQMLDLVKYQSQIDKSVTLISCLLETPPWDFGIFATKKGVVYGDLNIYFSNEEVVHCNITGGVSIPHNVNEMTKIETSASFIMVLEKDAVFQELLIEDLPNKFSYSFIMITGKGFSDISTRLFIKKLWQSTSIPVFVLVDCDPYGIEIMLNYRFGSLAQSHLSDYLALPQIRWLGVHPTEMLTMNINTQPLTQADRNKIKLMLKRPYIDAVPNLKDEINFLLSRGMKAEIEGVITNSKFMRDYYFPMKLCGKNYL